MTEVIQSVELKTFIHLFEGGGAQAFDTLLMADRRIVISSTTLDEIARWNDGGNGSADAMAWYERNRSSSDLPNSRIITINTDDIPEDYYAAFSNNGNKNMGELSSLYVAEASKTDLRSQYAAYGVDVDSAKFQLIVDDLGFWNYLENNVTAKFTSIERLNLDSKPFFGVGDYLNNLVVAQKLPPSLYDSIASGLVGGNLMSPRMQKTFLNSQEVSRYDPALLASVGVEPDANSGPGGKGTVLSGIATIGLIEIARQAGIVGDCRVWFPISIEAIS